MREARQPKVGGDRLALEWGLPWRFLLVKLLEDDPLLLEEVSQRDPELIPLLRNHQIILAQSHGRPPEAVISSERHALAMNLFEQVAQVAPARKRTFRDRLDSVATHRFWGYVILILVMGLFFQTVFRLGQYAENLLLSYLTWPQEVAKRPAWGPRASVTTSWGKGSFWASSGSWPSCSPIFCPFSWACRSWRT